MKKLIALSTALLSFSALADMDRRNMLDFDAASLIGNFRWTDTKNSGGSTDKDKAFSFSGRYAYSLTNHLQIGTQLSYGNASYSNTASAGQRSLEAYSALLGAYWNFDSDAKKALYVSAHAGWGWSNYTGKVSLGNYQTETFISRFAIGKRMPIFTENFTYSPEIVFTTSNPTKGGSGIDYVQDLTIKYLNFSVFF